MFLLSNMREAGIEASEHPRSGVYVGAFAGANLVGVACHYRKGNLVVNAPKHAVELGQAAVSASRRPLAGVVGPDSQVTAIADALGLPVGSDAQMDESDGLYRLELAQLRVPEPLRDGEVVGRPLDAADLDRVCAWSVRYHVETIGETETPELHRDVKAEHEAALGRGDIWVLERRGELVARTAYNARLPEAVQVGGVWTPHELRGLGFARCVVASHLLTARDAGVRTAILFTDDANTPARRAYAALGFERIGRYRLLLLRSPFRHG
ncbi:GNAT family N-acetyltransferase [Enhygromyxa salina]|nr:GNAT family N-acetyltransferase [Enhygromyxa salina]